MDKKRVLLIAGGWSPERKISLSGAEIIAKTLREHGHHVTCYDLSDGFEDLGILTKKVDVAFINLHGSPGEDGLVQAFLERLSCPYQGSRPAGSFLALNKHAAKALFKKANLLTANGFFLPHMPVKKNKRNNLGEGLSYPLFVKSNNGGSSLHLYRVQDKQELLIALEKIFEVGLEALVEEMIVGQEITCGVLGEKALPPVLIVPKSDFFDFANKYSEDGADELCPAPIGDAMTKKVQEMAVKAHRVLGLNDYSRSDFIMTANKELYILETNTLPGMTATSLIPKEAKAVGLGFYELLDTLLDMAMKKVKSRR